MALMTNTSPNSAVDPDGQVLEIGVPDGDVVNSSQVKTGTSVQKSGRTTGLTKGQIDAVEVSIVVNYGSGRYARFDNQITVTPGSFIAGGDSGSVMFADESRPRAVGLLFAGSSAVAIASPMDVVLARLGERNGVTLSMVGSQGGRGASDPMPTPTTAAAAASEPARAAKRQNEDRLLQLPDVVGVGVGHGSSVHVYLAKENGQTRRQIPASIDSVPVRVIVTGEITPR
jgi:hypothetical protein